MYRLSYCPSGEFNVTICSSAVLFFCTLTPCACTGSGSEASAICTRFCTSTWSMSGSVPIWNVTVRL